MIEESGWFRPPQFYEMCPVGDQRRYLWIAEPVLRGGVYGVGYQISNTALDDFGATLLFDLLKDLALAELRRRVVAGDARGEGEAWQAFEWKPVLRRVGDGWGVVESA